VGAREQLCPPMVGNLTRSRGTGGPNASRLHAGQIARAQDQDQPCTFLCWLNKSAFLNFSSRTYLPSMTQTGDGDFNLFIVS